jgi:glycosyltransferase involved in cell wall biosynthesis
MAKYVQDLLASDLATSHELFHFNTSFSTRVRAQGINVGHERYRAGNAGLRKYGYLFAGGAWQAMKTLLAGLWSVPSFVLLLVRVRPDVVHVFANMHWGFWRAGTMVLSARALGAAVAFHPLGAIEKFYPSCGATGRRLVTAMLDAADVVLLQSPGLARQVSAFTSRPTLGLFNGIEVEAFGSLATARRAQNGTARLLAVGDLGYNKGTWDILQAAGKIREMAPGARWTFLGRGDLGDLEARARDAGVADRVRFLGAAGHQEKMTAFTEADIFLLPSYGEGQPLAILEAMAAGLPVISTPVGSIAEVIGADNGLLVAPGDVEALAGAMRRLAADPELRAKMSAANLEAARERFDARRLWREIGEVWAGLIEERRR